VLFVKNAAKDGRFDLPKPAEVQQEHPQIESAIMDDRKSKPQRKRPPEGGLFRTA